MPVPVPPPEPAAPPPRPPPPICAPVPAPPFPPVPLDFEPPHAVAASEKPASKTSNARPARQPARGGATNIDRSRVGDAGVVMGSIVTALPGSLGRCPPRITGSTALVLQARYWAIRLFCSTFTRLSVQKVQFGP